MEIILTSNVGKVVQYSLQRRLLVWIGLNLLFSCTVYVAFAIAAAYLFPKDFASLSFLRFSLYCSCHIGLAFVVYCQYSSDGKKFGALGIREFPIQQTLKTAILAIAGSYVHRIASHHLPLSEPILLDQVLPLQLISSLQSCLVG